MDLDSGLPHPSVRGETLAAWNVRRPLHPQLSIVLALPWAKMALGPAGGGYTERPPREIPRLYAGCVPAQPYPLSHDPQRPTPLYTVFAATTEGCDDF